MNNNSNNKKNLQRDNSANDAGDNITRSEAEFDDDRDAIMSALTSMDGHAETPPAQRVTHSGDMIEKFISSLSDNAATAVRLPNQSAIPAAVLSYLQQNNLPSAIICTEEWQTLNWQAVGISANCRAPLDNDLCGLTGIIAAAADYGAMLIDSEQPHQLTMSLLPPHHLAILHAKNIHPLLEDVLEKSFGTSPRARNIICGPSRTADIEQTLTLGAHGPVAVHVMIIESTNQN